MRTSISRRDLYALGEPLGEAATAPKLCGGYVCGFGGSSSAATTNETNNLDNRVAVQDGIGVSNSANNNIQITDAGLVSRALDSVDLNNATNAEGFSKLLSAAQSLWNKGESLIGQTQKSVADAYSQAQTDAKGTIDNRTIMVIAVAGAAALAFASRRK